MARKEQVLRNECLVTIEAYMQFASDTCGVRAHRSLTASLGLVGLV